MPTLPPRHRRRHPRTLDRRGFTLVELMIVIVVIGVLAAIGAANYVRMQENAKRASCVANQRNATMLGTLYGVENGVGTAQVNVAQLRVAGLASADFGECPKSGNQDFDDYTLSFVDDQVVDCTCDVVGDDHPFTPGGN